MNSAIHIERVAPRTSILGEGLNVARTLPQRGRRMIGAWCFLDHVGPAQFAPDQGLHVGAHPHTHLQTFTWMIEGEILHRDSLGTELVIRPGQVNLMTAGHGIAHTEDSVQNGTRMHAAQLWIALPQSHAEMPPAFDHYAQLPVWQEQGVQWTLMAGRYGQRQSPAAVYTPMLGMELLAAEACTVTLPLEAGFEHGIMALEGDVQIEGQHFPMDDLAYLAPGVQQVTLQLPAGARVLVLGGAPFTEPVTIWWNFVGPDMAAIRSYREAWESGDARFAEVPGQAHRRLHAPALP